MTRHDMTGQDRTSQGTGQDSAGQDRTGQGTGHWTGQDHGKS